MKILLATENPNKTREMIDFLAKYTHVNVMSLGDLTERIVLPEETGKTMAENARVKAVTCAERTGLISLGDDSGIEVDAMNGAPGLYSARWFPGDSEAKCKKVLRILERVERPYRTCRYRCALCLAVPIDGKIELIEVEGVCEGLVAATMVGDKSFAYDPIFEISPSTGASPADVGQTFGQRPDLKAHAV